MSVWHNSRELIAFGPSGFSTSMTVCGGTIPTFQGSNHQHHPLCCCFLLILTQALLFSVTARSSMSTNTRLSPAHLRMSSYQWLMSNQLDTIVALCRSCIKPWTRYTAFVRVLSSNGFHGIRKTEAFTTNEAGAPDATLSCLFVIFIRCSLAQCRRRQRG